MGDEVVRLRGGGCQNRGAQAESLLVGGEEWVFKVWALQLPGRSEI